MLYQLKIHKFPSSLKKFKLRLSKDKKCIEYDYVPSGKRTGITSLLNEIKKSGINEITYRSSYIISLPENKIKKINVQIKEHMNLYCFF